MLAKAIIMLQLGFGLCLLVSVGPETLAQSPAGARGTPQDWPYYGGPGQTRYSPLKQITRENVNQLQVAWTFDTKETATYATRDPAHHGERRILWADSVAQGDRLRRGDR